MFGSQVLETAIGIALFFLAVSLFVTALQEFIATVLKLRANTLSSGIDELLEQKKNLDPVIQAIVNHPRVSPLDGKRSYISSTSFAAATIHVLGGAGDASKDAFNRLDIAVDNLPAGNFKSVLQLAVSRAQGDVTKVEQDVANWFDESMDRLSGRYKRYASYLSLGLGALLAVGMKLDAFAVGRALWVSPVLRDQAAAAAAAAIEKGATTTPAITADVLAMFGFQSFFAGFPCGMALLGCLVTAFAVSLGAPFWFDFLQSVVKINVRGTGDKPAKADGS
ncbi:hypothetical protein ACO0LG_17095 [Undibacterium sp. Ji42W]|uniref:hypothetical protein n=1 Tax=Undibacterium sp. Ji42W TaxID=3413039 RepID=UPI003BEF891D